MKQSLFTTALAALTALFIISPAQAETFEIDTAHSSITFKVMHNGISYVHGRFNTFEGTIDYDKADPTKSALDFKIMTDSIDTNNAKRDQHLQGPDFFNAKQFPVATFKSTKVTAEGDKLKIVGDFTLRGVTHPITITGKLTGTKDGEEVRAGGEGFFSFDRTKHGVSYGVPKVGEQVDVMIHLQGVKK